MSRPFRDRTRGRIVNHQRRQFGQPPVGALVVDRPGAYAIVIDGDRVLVIDDGTRFHLPGGDVEDVANTEMALARDLREETSHEIRRATAFHEADQFVTDDGGTTWRKACAFYLVELETRQDRPLPHESMARWAPIDAAIDLMAEDASRWALSVALCAEAVVHGLPGDSAA